MFVLFQGWAGFFFLVFVVVFFPSLSSFWLFLILTTMRGEEGEALIMKKKKYSREKIFISIQGFQCIHLIRPWSHPQTFQAVAVSHTRYRTIYTQILKNVPSYLLGLIDASTNLAEQ